LGAAKRALRICVGTAMERSGPRSSEGWSKKGYIRGRFAKGMLCPYALCSPSSSSALSSLLYDYSPYCSLCLALDTHRIRHAFSPYQSTVAFPSLQGYVNLAYCYVLSYAMHSPPPDPVVPAPPKGGQKRGISGVDLPRECLVHSPYVRLAVGSALSSLI
jgi:hypothetical protein